MYITVYPKKARMASDGKEWRFPSCNNCKNRTGDMECKAFPEGIPFPILAADSDHKTAYPGDHGIQFEPIEEEEDHV